MAAHVFWKGYLKLSLVTCPVTLAPATTDGDKVRFHTLNRATGNRIESRYVDADSGAPVDPDDEVKGFERGEGDYVLVEDDEIAAVALESTRTIDIDMFVDKATIGWLWYDKPHFLVPDDPVGEEAYSVIRDAMAATGTVGLAKLVLYRRERAVMLEPRDRGIVLWTLRYGDEVRDPKDYFDAIKPVKPEASALTLVRKMIDERTKAWAPAMLADPVQQKLLDLIAAKKKGRKPAKPKEAPAPPPAGNVINIMDALRKSIASEGKRPKGG